MTELISLAQQRDIEREVIVAGLAGALSRSGITAKELASRARVSPQHLSYVLHGNRTLSNETAMRIAAVLPVTLTDRIDWLSHVEAHHSLGRQAQTVIHARTLEDVDSLVVEAQEAHHLATFASTPQETGLRFRAALELGEILKQQAAVRQHPLRWVEVCFVLHDTYTALNRPHDALSTAKQARFAAELIEPRDYPESRERIDFIHVNTLRAESVAYHTLKLDERAFRLSEQAESLAVSQRQTGFWLPHIYRDQLNSLSGMSRFSVRQAQQIANRAHDACNAHLASSNDLLHLLISRSLAIALMKRDNVKASLRLFDKLATKMNLVQGMGALHRVMLLRSMAEAHSVAGDVTGASHWRSQAIALAEAGGLSHQLAQIRATSFP
jgi:transcriptional regulator with XRE-family HTH domain